MTGKPDGAVETGAVASPMTVAVAIAAGLGVALLIRWATTPLGPGLYGDGAAYLSAAESLARAGRLRVIGPPYWSADSTTFMAQWPPGFSLALAAPLRLGVGQLGAVALIQMLAAAVTVALTTALVGRIFGAAWAIAAAVAVIATPAVLGTDINVVSEPLYIAGLALLLWVMTRRPDRQTAAGLVAAGLVLVRYLGLAAVVGVGIWTALQPGTRVQRLRRVCIAMVPGIATYATWMVVVRRNGGAIRTIIVDRHVFALVRRLVGATAAWLAPWDDGPSAVRLGEKVAIVGLSIVAGLLVARPAGAAERGPGHPSSGADPIRLAGARTLVAAAAALIVCHLGILFAGQLLDSNVDFSARVLAPVHYLLTLVAVTALGAVWQGGPGAARLAAVAAAAIWLVGSAWRASELVTESRTVGLDHARVDERNSPMIAWLRTDGAALPIYTNEPAKIYFRLRRTSRVLPWIATVDTLRHLDQVLRERPGYVVWFAAGKAEAYVPASLLPEAMSPEKLTAGVALSTVASFPDGVIWAPDSAGPRPTKPTG